MCLGPLYTFFLVTAWDLLSVGKLSLCLYVRCGCQGWAMVCFKCFEPLFKHCLMWSTIVLKKPTYMCHLFLNALIKETFADQLQLDLDKKPGNRPARLVLKLNWCWMELVYPVFCTLLRLLYCLGMWVWKIVNLWLQIDLWQCHCRSLDYVGLHFYCSLAMIRNRPWLEQLNFGLPYSSL